MDQQSTIKFFAYLQPEKFDGKDDPDGLKFRAWKSRITRELRTASCVDYIQKIPAAPTDDYISTVNAIVGMILRSLSGDIVNMVDRLESWKITKKTVKIENSEEKKENVVDIDMECPHPKTIWDWMCRKYEGNTSVHMRLVIKKLISTKMGNDFDVYEAEMNGLFSRLIQMGEKPTDQFRLQFLLGGLPPSASNILSVIDSDASSTYSQAVSKLRNHFARESASFAMNGTGTRDDPIALNANLRRPVCKICNGAGHSEAKCYVLHPELIPKDANEKTIRRIEKRRAELGFEGGREESKPKAEWQSSSSSSSGKPMGGGPSAMGHFFQKSLHAF